MRISPSDTAPRIIDVIVQPLYDTVGIPLAGTTGPLTFFTVPKGQGTSVFAAASTKTFADTNLDLAAQLPAGYNFKILGFTMMLDWAVTSADLTLAFNGAVFEFNVGSKNYLRLPARMLPPGNGPTGTQVGTAAAGSVLLASNGWPFIQNIYSIARKPIDIAATQNFNATLTWPGGTGQAVTTTLAAGRTTAGFAGLAVQIYLHGFFYRYMQ
jgi:hypothetical protein